MGAGANGGIPGETVEVHQRLFRNPDFVLPYLAETQSVGGDQIGRVALSILVFDRTGSAAWTALTYALTYLPAILGGFVLGGIGDRFSRVRVMVSTDLARALLFSCVAIPGVPLPVVVALVSVAFFLGPAFTAAMVSRLATVLVADRFREASGIRMITAQVAQVGGFAAGGVIVSVVHPRVALIIDAATFVLSALIIAVASGSRSAAPGAVAAEAARSGPATVDAAAGAAVAEAAVMDGDSVPPVPRLLRDPVLRHLMLMTVLAAFFVVPEGLAVPVAHELDVSSAVSGLLLAAGPLGSAVGAALLVRLVPRRRGMRVAQIMSIGCGLPLLITPLLPPWPVVAACWAVSGALWAYQVDVATAFVRAVDERVRSRTVARASAVLLGAQGLGLIAFGLVGGWLGARWGVGVAGAAGALAAIAVARVARRQTPGTPRGAPRHRAGTSAPADNGRDTLSRT